MFPKVKSTGRNFVLIIEANKWYIMNTIENSNAFINFLLCIRHYLCRTEFGITKRTRSSSDLKRRTRMLVKVFQSSHDVWTLKNIHKHLGPPFQIRGGPGSFSRFHCYYLNIQVLLWSEKKNPFAFVGITVKMLKIYKK